MPRIASGKIIVAIVLTLGLGVGAIGAWWVVTSRPQPGAIIDALAVPGGALVVRHEKSSDRAFLELYDGAKLRWRAQVPTYAGSPGRLAMAASPRSVIVRTLRGGKPYVFAFDTAGGAKIDSFPLDGSQLEAVATVSSGGRHAAELLGDGAGGALVIGVDLDARGLTWRATVPWIPTNAWFAKGETLIVDGGPGKRLAFAGADGKPVDPVPDSKPPQWRHHAVGTLGLEVTPQSVTILDRQAGTVVGTIR